MKNAAPRCFAPARDTADPSPACPRCGWPDPRQRPPSTCERPCGDACPDAPATRSTAPARWGVRNPERRRRNSVHPPHGQPLSDTLRWGLLAEIFQYIAACGETAEEKIRCHTDQQAAILEIRIVGQVLQREHRRGAFKRELDWTLA